MDRTRLAPWLTGLVSLALRGTVAATEVVGESAKPPCRSAQEKEMDALTDEQKKLMDASSRPARPTKTSWATTAIDVARAKVRDRAGKARRGLWPAYTSNPVTTSPWTSVRR